MVIADCRIKKYPHIIACSKCGKFIHAMEAEVPYLFNVVKCPNCGFTMNYVRAGMPKKPKGE